MMMPTLILSPRHSEGSIRLWRAAIDLGWEVERLMSWRIHESFAPEEPILYGEPLFNEQIAGLLGIGLVEPPNDFLGRLPGEYVGRDVRLLTAAEARSLPGPVFLKPPLRKVFAARVYGSGADLPGLPDEEPVLASSPVEWVAEFRYFVRDRRVRTWSPYLLGGQLACRDDEWIVEPEHAMRSRELADRLLADPRAALPAAFVLDVGIIRGRGAAVVEANEAQASGIYGCDPSEVLEVLRGTIRRGSGPGR